MRRLPPFFVLVAFVLALGSTGAIAFRPPPGDRTDCTYNAEIDLAAALAMLPHSTTVKKVSRMA